MKKIGKVLIWLALAALAAAAGCSQGYYYSEPGPYQPYQPVYGSDVPPSFYNNDPALRHWYTAPYWNNNEMP